MNFRQEIANEYQSILNYWIHHTQDEKHGGFYGRIDHDNKVDRSAPKGSVLNARILWSFSAAYRFTKDSKYLQIARRSFDYLQENFLDRSFGGIFWTTDVYGHPLETKKQVYAQAFALYAYAEYYKASREEPSRSMAIELYALLQKHSYDQVNGGYFEAFSREWLSIADLRLSDKDANEKKTMNTHLHVLEAYSNLYTIWPDKQLKEHVAALLGIFSGKIMDMKNNHLQLFFEDDWTLKSNLVSYGHDIEAAWLMLEAAEIIGDDKLIADFTALAMKLADATLQGLDIDGGLWYEYDPVHQTLVKEKHWWPQAEAMVGFVTAWRISGIRSYYDRAVGIWSFIKKYLIDREYGEWFWGVDAGHAVMPEDKAGPWKCPYHNSRACLELLERL